MFKYPVDVQLRFVSPADIGEIKCLCQDWFPLEYPESWYRDITSNSHFFSLAAVYHGTIIGLIVAEIKTSDRINQEDSGLLDLGQSYNSYVAYILALGVKEEFRRCGIASLLLDSFLGHATTSEMKSVKVVYLHVLATNERALRFYEKQKFRMHAFLPYYYCINGQMKDGFTYCLYINGGHQPWTIIEYAWHWCATFCVSSLWRIPHNTIKYLFGALTRTFQLRGVSS